MKRLPKVKMNHGAFVGDRFQCSGPYGALPFNPFSHPQWPPFRVEFNGEWIPVQVIEYSEDWGWKAVSVEAVQRDADITPRVEVRGRR